MQTEAVQSLLKNPEKIEKIVNDINEISHKYYNLEPVTWKNLINHTALKPDEKLFKKLKQGYLNDKDLYYNQAEFEKILAGLGTLLSVSSL